MKLKSLICNSSYCFFVLWIQSDVSEVCGAAVTATSALQEHSAGATLCWTLEISGWRHPVAAHRTKRCKSMLFFFSVQFFYDFAPRHWTLRELTIALIWVVQTAFSDMYLGYTTTLASFLSLEFSRLNHPENSHKAQVFYSVNIIKPWCINQTRWWIFFPCLPFNRTARWRKRKWNCSPCCWHLCLASTATWATSRWVSSLRGSS